MDRRVPVEMQFLLVVSRLRLDAACAQCMPVDSSNFAALRFRINVVGIGGVFKYPEPIAVINVFPARIRDATGIRGIAHPNAVVLQSAIDVIRTRIVNAYVVELRRWQVPGTRPARTTITAAPEAAIVTGINLVCIIRVNPHSVIVTVCVGCGTEAATAVYAEQ